jgi:hypothetical protein
LVDYTVHPAYASLVASPKMPDRIKALWRFAVTWLIISVKRAIQYELIPLHVRRKGPSGLLRGALPHLWRRRLGRDLAVDRPDLSPLDLAMRRQGCAVVKIAPNELAALHDRSAEEFAGLAARRANPQNGPRAFEASRAYASRDTAGPLFQAVEEVLRNSGVLDCASRYLGRSAHLVDVNPQINDPTDDFWKRIFPDRTSASPKTAYLHRDASGGDLKAIFYLTDVGADNGPFGYVVGSHAVAPKGLDDRICETNDSNGLASTDPTARQLFSALPTRLRQKGAVGNDLLDTSDASAALLGSLWSITGPAGSLVVFDTKGMHRGGMVTQGERRVLTCVIG